MFLPISVGYSSTSNNPVFTVPLAAAFYVWCNKSSTQQGCQEWVGQLIAGMDATGAYLTSISISGNSVPSAAVAVHLTQ